MRIFIKKEAMCLLICYLWQYRRLCVIAFDNQISWIERTKYYRSNYLDRNTYVLEKLHRFLHDHSCAEHIKITCLDHIGYTIYNGIYSVIPSRYFGKYFRNHIDFCCISKIFHVFMVTDRIFNDKEYRWWLAKHNAIIADILIDEIIDKQTNCLKVIHYFLHTENIGYSYSPPMSPDIIMRKQFKKSEQEILSEDWFRP